MSMRIARIQSAVERRNTNKVRMKMMVSDLRLRPYWLVVYFITIPWMQQRRYDMSLTESLGSDYVLL